MKLYILALLGILIVFVFVYEDICSTISEYMM